MGQEAAVGAGVEVPVVAAAAALGAGRMRGGYRAMRAAQASTMSLRSTRPAALMPDGQRGAGTGCCGLWWVYIGSAL